MAILFPMRHDWKNEEGLHLARPIAVMVNGRVGKSEARATVDNVCAAIQDYERTVAMARRENPKPQLLHGQLV